MKIICIHPRLAGLTSHHFNEAQGFIHEFARRGKEFLLLISIRAGAQIAADLHARAVLDDPTFRRTWTFEQRSQRFLDMLHTHVDTDLHADDCVLITVSTQLEAHAFTRWLQELPRDRKPWIVILFLSDRWNRSGREDYERQIAEFRILRAAISSLAPADAHRLIFCTLTDLLAEELSDLLGADVDVVPMPLQYSDPCRTARQGLIRTCRAWQHLGERAVKKARILFPILSDRHSWIIWSSRSRSAQLKQTDDRITIQREANGREELVERRSRDDPEEAIGLLLIAAQRAEELLHLGWRWACKSSMFP